MLGIREPHIYGSTTLKAIKASCEEFAAYAGAQLAFHQSNHEGELVELIKSARTSADALIINPAAYSSLDCDLRRHEDLEGPIYEVHISNIHARAEFHRHSKLSAAVKGVIAGSAHTATSSPCRPRCRAPANCRRRCRRPSRVGPK